ncbi:MAG TPA: branched-chain amino acid ABC transporter permease [Acidimicrobiia bacterium]|jgi:branched-chain amino acid transport system permease protein|nr:branched-chain amino acid ABC transporter permease [Acidimicrobiia bacterium]
MSPLLAAVVSVGILVGIYGVVAIALNFQYGEAGLINFGVVAYFAVGAYTFAILTAGPPSEASLDQYRWGFDLHPLLAALIAGLVGVIFAAISGWPALRLRGEYLALTTFAFAEVLQSLLVNVPAVTNGTSGFANITQPLRGEVGNYNLFLLIVSLALLAVTMLFFQRLVRSPYGRLLRAIKNDEVGVTATGQVPEKYRRQVFFISAFFIALAGVVYVIWLTLARPSSFGAELTFFVWIAMILGGEGNNWGVLAGVLGLTVLDELIGQLPVRSVRGVQMIDAAQVFLTGLLFVLVLRWRQPRPGAG